MKHRVVRCGDTGVCTGHKSWANSSLIYPHVIYENSWCQPQRLGQAVVLILYISKFVTGPPGIKVCSTENRIMYHCLCVPKMCISYNSLFWFKSLLMFSSFMVGYSLQKCYSPLCLLNLLLHYWQRFLLTKLYQAPLNPLWTGYCPWTLSPEQES